MGLVPSNPAGTQVDAAQTEQVALVDPQAESLARDYVQNHSKEYAATLARFARSLADERNSLVVEAPDYRKAAKSLQRAEDAARGSSAPRHRPIAEQAIGAGSDSDDGLGDCRCDPGR